MRSAMVVPMVACALAALTPAAPAAAQTAGNLVPVATAMRAHPPSLPAWRAGRVVVASLGGLGLGVGLGVAGAMAADALACDGCQDSFRAAGVQFLGFLPGALLGASLGVSGVGGLLRGTGTHGWALAGAVCGALVAFPVVAVLAPLLTDAGADLQHVAAPAVLALSVAGAVLAYELASADAAPAAPRAAPRAALVPTLSVGARFVGVAGAF